MWLINIHTLRLRAFGDRRPAYAILSHRWRDEEQSFQDFQNSEKCCGKGFDKIWGFCQLVRSMYHQPESIPQGNGVQPGLPPSITVNWAWVDTVCIDKSSSAELSEAINSMWMYYQQCELCVAYLDDVVNGFPYEIRNSEWFSRGWTLQELLAPQRLLFCDCLWRSLGTREELARPRPNFDGASPLLDATGIEPVFLTMDRSIRLAPVAQRMSWAARRTTSRGEDIAYCLMGLFDVNMPLLYGEGREKAFLRLQGEIIRNSNDESIFAFKHRSNLWCCGALAVSPADFVDARRIRRRQQIDRAPYTITQKGLQIEGPAIQVPQSTHNDFFIIKLNCIQIMNMIGPDWAGQLYVDSQDGRCCILGVQKRDSTYVRRPNFEEEVLRMTSLEVEECLKGGSWKKIQTKVFFIATSEDTAKTLMSNRVEADFWDLPKDGKGKRRFVDADGLWFVGLPSR